MLKHRSDQYRVIPNCIDIERFKPADREAAQAALGLDGACFAVGVVASFTWQKNHAMCLRAAANLVSKGVPVKLVLVGDELHGGLGGTEGYKRDMPALMDELNLGENCVFLGNRLDLKNIYPAFDTTVLSSRFEGTPNVVLESMACLPAVVTDVSDNARLVVDGRTGYVVALDDVAGLVDCLERLWIEPALRAQLGKQARAWVQAEFSTERLARLTEAVYLEALEARGYGCA